MLKRPSTYAVLFYGAFVGREARAVQPERLWGTYLGGSKSDQIAALVVDPAGNVYVAGSSQSPENIATPGAHKSMIQSPDAFLVKFAPDGKRLWGTYVGGSDFEDAKAVAASADMVVIGGITYSGDGIGFGTTFQPTQLVANDGFIVAFTSAGQLAWGTYIGGGSVEALAVGGQGEIYAAGGTNGLLMVAQDSPHQPTLGGGVDGYVLRLDATGNKVWGTYYGGERQDYCSSLVHRPDGVLFVAGSSASTINIATEGVFQPQVSGADFKQDLFVAAFDGDAGTRNWATYFGGPAAEYIASATPYPGGGVVLAGNTLSSGLSTDATTFQAPQDGVLVRLDETGQRVWSTYFGGSDEEFLRALSVRSDGAIYFAGRTRSMDDIATMDAFDESIGGLYGGYVARLDGGSGQRVWSSYYAEDATGLAYFGGGLFMAGLTSAAAGIATPGAHQTEIGGVGDGYVVRFDPIDLQGASCAAASDCQSTQCVDGVCCDTPCGDGDDTDCQACSKAAGADVDGTCGPKSAGGVCRPAADACDTEEQCDGNDITCPPDVLADDGAPCPNGLCTAGMCIPQGTTGDSTGAGGTTEGPVETSGATSTTGTSGNTTLSDPTTGTDPTDVSAGPSGTASTGSSTGAGATDGSQSSGEVGCGCASTSSPGVLALLLVFIPRRRRNSCRTSAASHALVCPQSVAATARPRPDLTPPRA